MPFLDDFQLQIGRRHSECSQLALRLARWSSGAAVATWAFRNIGVDHGGHGLFASLNQDAWEALACLARVPVALPLAILLLSLYMAYGSFYMSVREVLVGSENRYRISSDRGMLVNRLIRQFGHWWKRWLVFGWWISAVVAGGVTVAVTGVLLRSGLKGWLVWVLVAALVWLVLKLEMVVTTRPYVVSAPDQLPTRQEAEQRKTEWLALRPGDTSGMPWIYAHSGLTTVDVMAQFRQLGSSGPVGFTSKLLGFVIIVLIYSALPAPSVTRFRSDGLIGCFFVVAHDFAGVAEENLGLSIAAALILLILLPISLLLAYWRFMARHRFPPDAVSQVLRRESGYALRMPLYSTVMLGALGLVMALVLWASAAVANGWNSPLAGLIVLGVPSTMIVWLASRSKPPGGPVPS